MDHMHESVYQPAHPPVDGGVTPADQAPFPTAEDRYRALFTTIDEGYGLLELIYAADGSAVDWRIMEVNPAFERLTGLTDTVGKTARDLNPATEPSWAALLHNVATTGDAVRFEHRAAGLDRWFEVYAARVGGNGSRTIAVVFNNITARKQAEAVNAHFAAIVHASGEAMISLSREGIIESWNPAAERLYGYTAAEATGQPIALIAPPDQRAEQGAVIARVHGGETVKLETVRRAKDGRSVAVILTAASLVDAAGQITGISATLTDITAQKQAEAERVHLLYHAEQARAAAEAALRVRDQFLATASHELRTPLTSLLGYASMLPHAVARGTAATEQMTARIIEQTHRLNGLIDQLLDVARLERGQFVIERRRVDLAALAAQVVDEVRTTLPPTSTHTLALTTPADPVVIDGDAERLEQVLHNLLSNALKYSPHGGMVGVEVTHTATEAAIVVTDQGIGIPADAQAHLFEPFYRASNVGTQASGFGLGLHIVREIVARHGGDITVASTEGAGATFRIVVPLGAAVAPATRSAS